MAGRRYPKPRRFIPKNPRKYKGDVNNIIFRSSWERRCMSDFDDNPNVLCWASEEIVIPYVSPKDGKVHRYFPDFVVQLKDRNGVIKIVLLEVKPLKEIEKPKVPKRQTPRFINEVVTYAVNQAKWAAAEKYCAERGWEFAKIHEGHLFPSKKQV